VTVEFAPGRFPRRGKLSKEALIKDEFELGAGNDE
jgi:hypothetical protein